jgi:uncharacterized membrane protein YjfL (UPF0719 family)
VSHLKWFMKDFCSAYRFVWAHSPSALIVAAIVTLIDMIAWGHVGLLMPLFFYGIFKLGEASSK